MNNTLKKILFLFLFCLPLGIMAQDDPLEGKTIVFLGDSYVKNHRRPVEETWHYKVAEKHHMVYRNYGRNGSAIAFDRRNRGFGKAMCERYVEMTDTADYVVIIAGHNDADFIIQHDDSLKKFEKKLEELCVGLRKKYPQARIAFVSPWNVDHEGFPSVIDAEEDACRRHGFAFFNAALNTPIDPNSANYRKLYFQGPDDRAHLTSAGHDIMVPLGEKFLLDFDNNIPQDGNYW